MLEQEKVCNKSGQMAHRLAHMDMVVLDELGYLPFSASGGALLFHLCWRRFKIEPPCRLNFEPGLQASLRGPAVDKCSA
jgi:hypothetical protein